MALMKVQNMSLIAQPANALCWWASSQMCYLWSQATGSGSMIDPLDETTGYKMRYDSNLTVGCDQNGYMADKFKMKKFTSMPMNVADLSDFLTKHGPVFTSVWKNWNGNDYGHAVVTCGAADTGVFIYDPMPVNQGSSLWLTWDQIQKAIDGVADVADYGFLTAA